MPARSGRVPKIRLGRCTNPVRLSPAYSSSFSWAFLLRFSLRYSILFPLPEQGCCSDPSCRLFGHSPRGSLRIAWDIPHQLCHFHYLREAAKPIYEADRHAKKELKKQVRGIRPIEREVEHEEHEEATITRKYCLAIRSALTDDGRPPLSAPGLKLYERLSLIAASLERVAQKGGCHLPSTN